jgi:hypothetical protein
MLIINTNKVGEKLIISFFGRMQNGEYLDSQYELIRDAFKSKKLDGVKKIIINSHRDPNKIINFNGHDKDVSNLIRKVVPLDVTVKVRIKKLAEYLKNEFVMTSSLREVVPSAA